MWCCPDSIWHVTGPKLRYLERHATYVLKVTNPGSAPASNVSIVHQLPPGFKFDKASNGGRHDFTSRTVSWFIGDLAPGESRDVSMDVIAVNIGDYHHKTVATAARGLKTECEVTTRVEGLSALLMELVDTDDPIEVGAETSYEIRVTNTGSKTETNLELVCTVPDKMEFRGAKCAAGCRFRLEGKELIFEPLPRWRRGLTCFTVWLSAASPPATCGSGHGFGPTACRSRSSARKARKSMAMT